MKLKLGHGCFHVSSNLDFGFLDREGMELKLSLAVLRTLGVGWAVCGRWGTGRAGAWELELGSWA